MKELTKDLENFPEADNLAYWQTGVAKIDEATSTYPRVIHVEKIFVISQKPVLMQGDKSPVHK